MTGLPLFHAHFDLPLERIKHTMAPYYYRREDESMSELEFSQYCADQLEAMILEEGPETVAAMIAEPVLGTGGIVPPPEGYWQAIRKVLDKYDVLLIADEVVCGFGRLGSDFGSLHYDMKPDLITVAKGLTSAYQPLSGVIVGERVWSVLKTAPTNGVLSDTVIPTPVTQWERQPRTATSISLNVKAWCKTQPKSALTCSNV